MRNIWRGITRLANHLANPLAADRELARRQFNLNIVVLGLSIPGLTFGVITLILSLSGLGPPMPAVAGLGLSFVFLIAFLIGRRGWVKLASALLLTALLLTIALGLSTTDLDHLAITGLAALVTVAGFLFGTSGAFVFTLLSLAVYLLAPLYGPGSLDTFVFTPAARITYSALGLGFGLVTMIGLNWLAMRQATQGVELERRTDAIEQERDFAESVIQTAHAFIVVLDLEGRVQRVNPFTERITGYTSKEIVGIDWFETFLPRHGRKRIRSIFREILKTSGVRREVNALRTKDGRDLIVEWHSSTLLDKQGTPSAVLAIGIDLTDQMRAREDASAREAQMTGLFRVSPMGIGMLKDRTFLLVNDRFCDMLGYSLEELIGQSTRIIYPDEQEYEQAGVEVYGAVRQTGIGVAETRMRRKDGTIINVLEGVAPVDPDDPDGEMVFTTQDVTTLKHAETERRLSEYSIDQAGEAILWTGSDSSILRANPTACRILDYRQEELLQMRHSDISLHLQDGEWQSFWSRLAAERTIVEQTTWRRKDGHLIPVEVSQCFFTFEGKDYIMTFARDMTEIIKTQNLAKAQERLAAIGQLAAGIAHDFNNIMAGIILYSQMMQREEGITDPGRERLERIRAQAHRGANLISQILDFSRQSVIELEPTDLRAFLIDLQDLLRRTLPENIELTIETDEVPYVVKADPGRLQQIVMNLAINARDAMPGGGELTIRLDGIQVRTGEPVFRDMTPGNWVSLQVVDTGTGISAENINHVFEPFFTTKEAGKGTGLGLAQVYGIVKQHEGYIDVESEPGEGTRFIIYLPRGTLHDLHRPAEETDMQLELNLSVLLVEDDGSVRAAISDMLELFGCSVTMAKTGREALEILSASRDKLDLVLSDMIMPTMGGRQLFEAVHASYPRIDFILMTGYPLGMQTRELIDRRYAVLLRKPFTAEELGEAIRTSRQRVLHRRKRLPRS